VTTYPNDLQLGDLGDPAYINALKNNFLAHASRHLPGGLDPITGIPYLRQLPKSYTLSRIDDTYYGDSNVQGLPSYSGDDYSTILQSCINSMPGGIIEHKAGTFVARIVVTTKASVIIIGEGPEATIIWLDDGSNCDVFKWAPTVNSGFAGFSNLRIDGNKANNTSGRGIVISRENGGQCWDLYVTNVWIARTKDEAFYTEDLWGHKYNHLICEESDKAGFKCPTSIAPSGFFSGCRFSDNLIGMDLKARKATLLGTEIDHNKRDGIILEGAENVILGGYVIQNSQEGAGLYDGLTIKGSTNTVLGVFFRGHNMERYGVNIPVGYTDNIVIGNNFVKLEYTVAPLFNGSKGKNIVRPNIGYKPEPALSPEDIDALIRMQEESTVYYDSPYFVIRAKAQPVDGKTQHATLFSLQELDFGTFEGKAKIIGSSKGEETPFGFINHYGFPLEGIACFVRYHDGSQIKHKCWSAWDGLEEETILADQDWTVERTFKIAWASSLLQFLIDDVLKATHSTRIPQNPMNFFAEACAYPEGSEAGVYFRNESFRRLV
jgi:hypothetical protein